MSLLPKRNVVLESSDGTTLAGFWQYGTVSWSTFTTWLISIIETPNHWAIFEFDAAGPDNRGRPQPFHSAEIVPPGNYILLQQDGGTLSVNLTGGRARLRQPTHTNTPARQDHYRERARQRDGARCLVTNERVSTWSRLEAAHIFPRAHDIEWLNQGFHSLIKDDAASEAIGGNLKIDSIQNVIMLRSDLHRSWDNYEFGVNPDDGYRITAFISGLGSVHGLQLQLDHITDTKIRPLDALFRDHFSQGVLTHVKGAGEPTWDYEGTFGDGSFDLSRENVWRNAAEGQERFELELRDRLFETLVSQTA